MELSTANEISYINCEPSTGPIVSVTVYTLASCVCFLKGDQIKTRDYKHPLLEMEHPHYKPFFCLLSLGWMKQQRYKNVGKMLALHKNDYIQY